MDIRKHIGDRIYDFRIGQGLSQEEFVQKLDIYYSRANLSNIENGLTMPSAEFVYLVCKTYNISADWLLGLDTKKYLSKKEQSFLKKFRKLNVSIQQNILDLVDSILQK